MFKFHLIEGIALCFLLNCKYQAIVLPSDFTLNYLNLKELRKLLTSTKDYHQWKNYKRSFLWKYFLKMFNIHRNDDSLYLKLCLLRLGVTYRDERNYWNLGFPQEEIPQTVLYLEKKNRAFGLTSIFSWPGTTFFTVFHQLIVFFP